MSEVRRAQAREHTTRLRRFGTALNKVLREEAPAAVIAGSTAATTTWLLNLITHYL